jgi:hypothetical protein
MLIPGALFHPIAMAHVCIALNPFFLFGFVVLFCAVWHLGPLHTSD